MDAFYAAIEELDDPSLRGRPVIVGGTPQGHGVVSTANYVARRFGIHSAMPASTAVRLCPDGVFLRPRMRRYVEVSRQVFAIFDEYAPLVEPLSIDEAFLDVTGCRPLNAPVGAATDAAEAIAEEIRLRVHRETGGLTCSIGVAPNKFLAKLASDLRKPDAVVVVPTEPSPIEAFLAPLPVRRLWGVGPRSAERLRELGVQRVGDLQRIPPDDLQRLIGVEHGGHLARLARGVDDRAVVCDREAKSISQERTYGEFIPASNVEAIEDEIFALSDHVACRVRRAGLWARTVQLKVRDEQFTTVTRSCSLDSPTCVVEEIFAAALELWRQRVHLRGRRVRLLGVGTSRFVAEPSRQLDLFEADEWKRAEEIATAMDRVRDKLGHDAITRGRLVRAPGASRRASDDGRGDRPRRPGPQAR